MDIERGFLEVIFKKTPYDEVYKNDKFNGTKISKEVFCKYSCDVFPQYSEDERNNIFDCFEKDINNGNGKGLFEWLAKVAESFLTYDGREILCKYEQILRWRETSFKLGQDLFTTAYLAKLNFDFGKKTQFFAWSPIIKTDNRRLHNILNQGMAENHFHLGGSTQIFALSWTCLMNHIIQRSNDFKKIKVYLDNNTINRAADIHKDSLHTQCIKASCIRLHLFAKMHDGNNIEADSDFNKINLDKKNLGEIGSMSAAVIQRRIDDFKFEYSSKGTFGCLDYAYEKSIIGQNEGDNRILAGERKFLYDCFMNIFKGNFGEKDIGYFLIYLKIKELFRSELVQTNGKVGFKNFSDYQDRKGYFIKGYKKYEHELVRMALNSTLESQNVESLEARICPEDSLRENIEIVRYYDYHAKNKKDPYELLEERAEKPGNSDLKHFYVLHFVKISDKTPFCRDVERDAKLRRKYYSQAKEIVALFEADNSAKYRIRGIDACSNEINCRPEVFAQVFRYLTNINLHKRLSVAVEDKPISINATYHAGEDFLDISDGLRAIDEAVLFCNLKRGSRLGHALALGLDVPAYYKFKNCKLILYKQDILDNVAWLAGKASEYGIAINSSLLCCLEQKFYELYNYIYDGGNVGSVTIWDCYNAWKLRGDKPELYLSNKLDERMNKTSVFQSEYFEINRIVPDSIRKNKKCRGLYYRYHYDEQVRKKGKENAVFEANDEYIQLVQQIQKKMQIDIAGKGISIECNPSSNCLISTIPKYEQHPIVRLNNTMLTYDAEEIRECPQISVSVNTDDQGVFETLLENEYAILALALEKCKDENGNKKYKPSMVYDWIDHIRKLGLEQVF